MMDPAQRDLWENERWAAIFVVALIKTLIEPDSRSQSPLVERPSSKAEVSQPARDNRKLNNEELADWDTVTQSVKPLRQRATSAKSPDSSKRPPASKEVAGTKEIRIAQSAWSWRIADGRALFDPRDEFRAEAQLIVVSHQKRTMEAADCLIGVTMAPGGSSRVITEKVATPAS